MSGSDDLDIYEQWTKTAVTPVRGPLRHTDTSSAAEGTHDFEADLPDGAIAAIEVTGEVHGPRPEQGGQTCTGPGCRAAPSGRGRSRERGGLRLAPIPQSASCRGRGRVRVPDNHAANAADPRVDPADLRGRRPAVDATRGMA